MKKTNKLISILLAVLMLLSMAPLSLTASAATSGSCGDGVSFSISNGTLTISGSGHISESAYNWWNDETLSIQKIVIENGVNISGDYCLSYHGNLSSVIFNGTVNQITGTSAFGNATKLTSFQLLEGVGKSGNSFFNCKKLTPEGIKLVDANGNDKTSFYTVSIVNNDVSSSNHAITVIGNLEKGSVNAIPDQYYTGGEIRPAVTVSWNGQTVGSGNYNVSYSNNTELGTATVTVTGKGNYTGTLTQTFNIVARDMTGVSAADVEVPYDLEPHGITVTGAPEGATITYSTSENGRFTEEQPVIINVADSNMIYYKVSAPGYNDYIGYAYVIINFKNIAECNVYIENPIYNGHAQMPNFKVIYDTGHGEYTLKKDTDYTVSYGAVNAGDATLTLTAKGNFIGTATVNYTVEHADIGSAEIILDEFHTYNGTTQTQSVKSVIVNGFTLVEGTDYVVTGNTGMNAGAYTLTITGINNAIGTVTKEWKINRLPVTVTADNVSKNYGEAEPALGFTVSREDIKSSLAGELVRTEGENVGVYAITQGTLTNENNPNFDITFVSGKFTIEPDVSGIEGITPLNVKSSDKAKIEYVYNQLENAVTDLADADKRAEWDNLKSDCVEMLAVISDTAVEINRINDAVAAYDISTVTGNDVPALVQLADDTDLLLGTDNLTAEEREALVQTGKDIQRLISIYDTVSAQLGSIKDRMNGYDEATVKSSDKADIEQLKADIKELTDGQNLTAEEREYLVNADAECDKFFAKIAETTAEYNRVIAAANGYDKATVTSADRDALDKLRIDAYRLSDTDNVTPEEKENLQIVFENLTGMVETLINVGNEIERIISAVGGYDEATVKYSDYKDILQLIDDIEALTNGQNITEDERANLEELNTKSNLLVAKIRSTADEIARITRAVNAYNIDTVKSSDKTDIENLIARIRKLTNGDNITADEREQLNSDDATLNALLAKINATADEIARIEEAVNSYDEATVKSTDKADLEQFVEDIKALTDATNITEDERTTLGELDTTVDSLIKKIDDTAAEIERIEETVNSYDAETVTSDDVPALGKLIEDIKALTDGDNITEDERATLEADDATVDALVEKLAEVAEEIKKVDEIVKSYDEKTVKSTDKDDLEQLKEDVQALIDSGNTTENEKTVLGEMVEKIETLEDKIEEIEQQLEEIAEIENSYNPETVTSDDKADVEETIAEIDAVNPDNLTDEQKAEYAEIKAELEALLNEIETAEKDVADIGTELEMFDEKRVTIFWEEDIEALKAELDELLADENMGEAEKAKLNEYKSQCDTLIEIIHAPLEYFSLRLFYFIWDCLTWKWFGFTSLFN